MLDQEIFTVDDCEGPEKSTLGDCVRGRRGHESELKVIVKIPETLLKWFWRVRIVFLRRWKAQETLSSVIWGPRKCNLR